MKRDYTMDDFRAEMRRRGVSAGRDPQPDDHRPLISPDRTKIAGCTCGWQTPSSASDSDDAFATHAAISHSVGGKPL